MKSTNIDGYSKLLLRVDQVRTGAGSPFQACTYKGLCILALKPGSRKESREPLKITTVSSGIQGLILWLLAWLLILGSHGFSKGLFSSAVYLKNSPTV